MGDDDEEGASVEVEVGSDDLPSANVIDDLQNCEKCGLVEGQKQVGNINRSRSNLKEMHGVVKIQFRGMHGSLCYSRVNPSAQ